jgi:hypothetical protein
MINDTTDQSSEHFLGLFTGTKSTAKIIDKFTANKPATGVSATKLTDRNAKVEAAKRVLESEKKRLENAKKKYDVKLPPLNNSKKESDRLKKQKESDRLKKQKESDRLKKQKESDRLKKQKESDRLKKQKESNRLKKQKTSIKSSKSKRSSKKRDVPFTKSEMIQILKDVLNASSDEKLAFKILKKSQDNEYYEILVQILQTNIHSSYKMIKKDHNKINKLILDLKLKRMETINMKNIENIENMKNMKNMKKENKDDLSADELKKLNKSSKSSKSESRELSNTMQKYLNKMIKQGKYIDDSGFVQNMVDNDMKYTQYTPQQQEKLGTYDATFTNKWNNDYALLNTDKWRPPIGHHMYKCKQETKCPVCPSLTAGYPVALKEYDVARKILQPDNINVDYINEKLLTGLA